MYRLRTGSARTSWCRCAQERKYFGASRNERMLMSDAESTVAVEKTATTSASATGGPAPAQEPALVVERTTVVETPPVVVETSRSFGAAPPPTMDNVPVSASAISPPTTPSPAGPSVAALMSRRFRGYLPVVIDVETGGFHSSTDALLEIAAVIIDMDPDGTAKRGTTNSFHVKPVEAARLDPAALAITGIDPF